MSICFVATDEGNPNCSWIAWEDPKGYHAGDVELVGGHSTAI